MHAGKLDKGIGQVFASLDPRFLRDKLPLGAAALQKIEVDTLVLGEQE